MINTNFKSILDLLKEFKNEQTCIDHLEQLRWDGNVVSPFDYTSKVYKCKGNKYHCHNTKKYFNVKTSTLFDNTKIPLQKWFLAIYYLVNHNKGISSVQLAKDLGTTQKTAWFMAHRIRNCFGISNDVELDGTIEADESFIGGKNKNRHKDKKVANSQGRSYKDKTPVLGIMERRETETIEREHKVIKGRIVKEVVILKPSFVVCRVVENTQKESVQPIVRNFVKEGSRIISDEWSAYTGLNSDYDHYIVNHSAKEFVNENDRTVHSNSIEGFWTGVKKAIIATYSAVSRKHLQKYADESAFRYNTLTIANGERINKMLFNLENRLTYKMLIK